MALKVFIAAPLGPSGRGGIDRMMDLIVAEFDRRPDLSVEVTRFATRGGGSIALAPFYLLAALIRLLVARLSSGVDVLHVNLASHGSSYRKLILCAWARLLRIPYVVHLHGGLFDRFVAGSPPAVVAALRRMFRATATIIVLGEHWARVIDSNFPEAHDKIVILANACPAADHDRSASGSLRILFLGKLVRAKGVTELVAALGRLKHRSDWVATIAGEGDVAAFRRDAYAHGIGDRVEFPGWLDIAESSLRLRQADIFVLPSFIENLPLSVIEAFAAGVATVATPVGAIPEVISDGDNGLLVPPGDVDALAAALERLMADADLRTRLGDNAKRDHVNRYDIGAYVVRVVSIWKRAAESRSR